MANFTSVTIPMIGPIIKNMMINTRITPTILSIDVGKNLSATAHVAFAPTTSKSI